MKTFKEHINHEESNDDTPALHSHLKKLKFSYRSRGMDDWTDHHYSHKEGVDHSSIHHNLVSHGFQHTQSKNTHHYERFQDAEDYGTDKVHPHPEKAGGADGWHRVSMAVKDGKVHKVKVQATNADNADH